MAIMQTISVQSLRHKEGEDLILDVRSPEEYLAAHVPGSVLHPLSELDPEVVGMLSTGKRRCVVLCESGARAKEAAAQLTHAGIQNVVLLEGGISEWIKAGQPVRGTGRFTIERQIRIAAGALVLTGVILSFIFAPAWIGLSAFVGAGLVFAGVTNFCGMGLLLGRMPWNQRRTDRPAASCCR